MTETVKILISPAYGSGWYSWNTQYPELLTDPRVIAWIENGKPKEERPFIVSYLKENYLDVYIGSNLDDLQIAEVAKGRQFRITEYDGYEGIQYADEVKWHIA